LWIYGLFGIFAAPVSSLIWPVIIISLVGTLVETLPVKDLDNVTVPVAAVLLGLLLF